MNIDDTSHEKDGIVEWTEEEIQTLNHNLKSFPEGDYSEFKRLTLLLTKLPRKRLRDVSARLEYYKQLQTNPTLTWKDFYCEHKLNKQKRMESYSPRSSSSENDDCQLKRKRGRSRSKSKEKQSRDSRENSSLGTVGDSPHASPLQNKDLSFTPQVSPEGTIKSELTQQSLTRSKSGINVPRTKQSLPIKMSEYIQENKRTNDINDYKTKKISVLIPQSPQLPLNTSLLQLHFTSVPSNCLDSLRSLLLKNERVIDQLFQYELQTSQIDFASVREFSSTTKAILDITEQMAHPLALPIVFNTPISLREIQSHLNELGMKY
ncbi:hypothetical protein CL6EHI_012080 [Entamoeba histolytica]|uniref:Uncharacterized protein n=4 Tax=Entamoeba histolytica TaxID=5759 RepID=C4LTK1_ENTH1|nr:hypothetical protein EHI_012080 [Entamoeba histolytica HM-1:IMSS]EAL50817.1 hypothetical protein EHI_012080 [Entamoeba histolytica HM-1:IMSS]EMD45799.1 Hypothetical protein EHI5A_250650 [Entamoeba histolytica KU27]ENY64673.1 hypothetical protein EHI7A_201940 [Entamoeba histolytica HM-1:IMSS-A]GAT91895.1 hypothetical protein CL6EHI_012080 [Entamoeba histolytica]|eukprot:XP_656201.1 hypothetical protein EHI_012080 [Entamoeba histolytica HM-1:IMSS]